jgi:hypothetical protein
MNVRVTICVTVFVIAVQLNAPAAVVPTPGPGDKALQNAIPWKEVGAAAGAQYSGKGLRVTPTEQGAQLHCAFQRLDGLATHEGLWLSSTMPGQPNDRFRVKAVAVSRKDGPEGPFAAESALGNANPRCDKHLMLSTSGEILVVDQTVRFIRPGLVEEYSVSMNGVQQDFLVLEKPEVRVPVTGLACDLEPLSGAELHLKLSVTGARVGQTTFGAQLVLEQSGRKIAYSRLRVTDASGKELPARMVVARDHGIRGIHGTDQTRQAHSSSVYSVSSVVNGLEIAVDDSNAVYPLRIDPTFSDASWVSLGGIPGPNGIVHASVVDGAGNLYIGGEFTLVGDIVATNVARWNGSTWSALGSGLGGYPWAVYALAVSGSNVYAGGSFTNAPDSTASCIARWDGRAWSALGSGIGTGNGATDVRALAMLGSDLYVGGEFTTAGGIAASNIAKWDGSTWTALGSGLAVEGGSFSAVYALAVSGSNLYAGGNFYTAGGSPGNNIAKWDGNVWNALGSGTGGEVLALAVSGSDLYAGGDFTLAGGKSANGIAKWDGSAWTGLDSGIGGGIGFYAPIVSALAVLGSNVYAGGSFTNAGGSQASCIARWDCRAWSTLGSGIAGGDNGPYPLGVYALAVSGRNLYAAGNFTSAGSAAANYVAIWNSNAWSTLGLGMGGASPSVSALVMSGNDLYAGGSFIMATGTGVATNIAKWNGRVWSALGSGLGEIAAGNNPVVSALAVSGTNVYAGGSFTNAGDIAVNNIAKWNGSAWSPLGSGMGNLNGIPTVPPAVKALAVSGGEVYAGGYFDTAGGIAANCIAKWDGNAWSALGLGVGGETIPYVLALAVSGSNVYAGGFFTTAGGNPATNIAKWDGSAWSALGPGLGGYVRGPVPANVYGLAISGNDLYAAGLFTTADHQPDYLVAKWNGSTWNSIGSGMAGPLAVSGSNVYVGIDKWDGTAWTSLGSGLNGGVGALAVSGTDLYVGGNFTMAGGKVSAYVAKLIIGPPPFYILTTNGTIGLSNSVFTFTLTGPAGSNAVIFASTDLQTWTPLVTNSLTGGSLNFTDTLATNFTRRFYRALLQP